MRKRTLGRTGLEVSEVGFGCGIFGGTNYLRKWDPAGREERKKAEAAVRRAIELGCNYFDTAPGYGPSEELLGGFLKGFRDGVIIATKISPECWSPPERVAESVEESLRRLKTDRIDVIQFHGGAYFRGEESRILDGALEAVQKLRDQGKVRLLGFTTENSSGGVQGLIESGAFDAVQMQYNLLYQNAADFEFKQGVMYMAEEHRMGVVIMRTLSSGRFQKVMRTWDPSVSREEMGRLLLNYVLSNPMVDTALVGMRDTASVELCDAVSEDAGMRIDLEKLHDPWV